ncbi:hypothetical protein QBC47DRAFT_386291 [Echria macrotheca]|uniref:F-box domain-containing protein n=1 Tax=Echria macrotheca TaxID=438768 RepID=A0AAJ0B8F1_9PEZI|nr:hypothetical protein QBC47DRAFT_386291 [Echria macrotheca]
MLELNTAGFIPGIPDWWNEEDSDDNSILDGLRNEMAERERENLGSDNSNGSENGHFDDTPETSTEHRRDRLASAHILDLPNEILVHIMQDIFDSFGPDDAESPVKTIKRCRLTCRRLANVGASFLVSGVRVHLNSTSLARLEAIADHPIISTSVRNVRFELATFKASTSNHITDFADDCMALVRWELHRESRFGGDRKDRFKRLEAGKNRWHDLFLPILESWDRLATAFMVHVPRGSHKVPDHEQDDKPHWDFLRHQHREYQRLHRKQRRLFEKHNFYPRVAAAIAKMPFANSIQFHDLDILNGPRKKFPFSKVKNLESAYTVLASERFFLQPEPMVYGVLGDFDEGLMEFLENIFWFLAEAGRFPTSVGISLPGTNFDQGNRPFASNKLILGDIGKGSWKALQKLESFSFFSGQTLGTEWSHQRSYYEVFLAPFFHSPCLRSLVMHHHMMDSDIFAPQEPDEDMTRILTYRPKPCLKEISLRGVRFTQRALESLVKGVKGPMERVEFAHMNLKAGTWAGVLEILRGLDCRYKKIEFPRGAEVDSMDVGVHVDVFSRSFGGFESKADAFINGYDMDNPMGGLNIPTQQNSSDSEDEGDDPPIFPDFEPSLREEGEGESGEEMAEEEEEEEEEEEDTETDEELGDVIYYDSLGDSAEDTDQEEGR